MLKDFALCGSWAFVAIISLNTTEKIRLYSLPTVRTYENIQRTNN